MLSMFMNSDLNIKMFLKYGVLMVIDQDNYRNISHKNSSQSKLTLLQGQITLTPPGGVFGLIVLLKK